MPQHLPFAKFRFDVLANIHQQFVSLRCNQPLFTLTIYKRKISRSAWNWLQNCIKLRLLNNKTRCCRIVKQIWTAIINRNGRLSIIHKFPIFVIFHSFNVNVMVVNNIWKTWYHSCTLHFIIFTEKYLHADAHLDY